MLNKIGISILLFALVGCSTPPVRDSYKERVEANEILKIDYPEYIKYTVKGLASLACKKGICSMSEADFRQNQHDKKQLLRLHKINHQEDVAMANAYNTLIDTLTLEQIAGDKYLESAAHWEAAYDKERNMSLVRKWIERILFGGAILIGGSL